MTAFEEQLGAQVAAMTERLLLIHVAAQFYSSQENFSVEDAAQEAANLIDACDELLAEMRSANEEGPAD